MRKKFKILACTFIFFIIWIAYISPSIHALTITDETPLINFLENGNWRDSPFDIKKQGEEAKRVAVQCAALNKERAGQGYYVQEIPLSKDIQKYIYQMCSEKNLNYDLILSIIKCESNFKIDSIGYNDNGTFDSGLMQINSCHIASLKEQYGISDIMDPYSNILVGISMISSCMDAYGETGGLVAYNMGVGGYQACIAKGNLNTAYVQKVTQQKEIISSMTHL